MSDEFYAAIGDISSSIGLGYGAGIAFVVLILFSRTRGGE